MTDKPRSTPDGSAQPGAGSRFFRAIRALFRPRSRLRGLSCSGHAAIQVISVTDAGTHTMLMGRTGYGMGHAPARPVTPPTLIDGCVYEHSEP
jgi:hypothetical protein